MTVGTTFLVLKFLMEVALAKHYVVMEKGFFEPKLTSFYAHHLLRLGKQVNFFFVSLLTQRGRTNKLSMSSGGKDGE